MADDISSVARPDAITQLYNSLPVSSKRIRLLQILACGSQGTDAPLRCRLYVADLESAPSYAALSYVWGTYANPQQQVYCNDVAVAVTSNCHSALRHLRAMLGAFTIWVDAICINQEEVNDKMHQIGIMGDIYSKAQTTYVLLGDGTAATDRVMNYLGRAGFLEFYYRDGQGMRQKLEKPGVWGALMSYYMSRWGFSKSTMPYRKGRFSIPLSRSDVRLAQMQSGECSAQELTDFFKCVWMSRIWTFQEIILSSNPVVVCGNSSLQWARLEHSIMFLMTVEDNNASLLEWADIVLTRDMFLVGDRDCVIPGSRLLKYESFCTKVANRALWLRFLVWAVLIGSIFFFLELALSVYNRLRRQETINHSLLVAAVTTTVLSYFGAWATFGVEGLAPKPGYRILANPMRTTPRGLHLRPKVNKRLVEALRARQAQDHRDMSWGLRSVLLRLYGDAPVMHLELSLPEVYEQLTKYLLLKDDCLEILRLAARKHCDDSPSWVPDFAERLDHLDTRDRFYEQFMLEYGKQAFDSQLYYGFHDTTQKILAVKGLILGQITSVKKDPKPRGRAQAIQTFKAASYRGISLTGSAQVGDKLVLIAGLPTPLVLRDDGQYMKIVTAFTLRFDPWRRDFLRPQTLVKVWLHHERKRKIEWTRTHGRDTSRCQSRGPVPQMYLEDILIC